MPRTELPAGLQVFERGWLSSNNILFIDANSTALVDSGYMTHAAQTLALVQHALQGRPLELLINTHLHSDHCGGNAVLQQAYRCRTLIPVADVLAVAAWDEDLLTFKATGQRCQRFTFDDSLSPGQQLHLGGLTWQALAAPGHDPHSFMLYCASEAILISADALWQNGFGVIFPELEGESGFAEQAAVLNLIEALDVRIVIPGHGAPFSDVADALERARSRLDYLSADPRRNARNALKVMIAFQLLESQQLPLPQIRQAFNRNRLMQASASLLDEPLDPLLESLTADLVKSGVARLQGGSLVSTR
ncbi:MBL fold metallo-hydrolase [Undibacterium sp. Jales W-56]|uniref:MBL fold metallo-hydrolase n=1 Tax=Undibacterium sp. Jales W-56 TaxID=2897325 RepID=UPI0021D0093B|nr:MBL fold metallo-hydrolase [Undibacterium sp. Jales W-56]MCU6434067.1 MBL fold metallo-hydrolase [Undibacterium sp. Jales W-56]